MKKLVLLSLLALLTQGCGVEWFPEAPVAGTAATTTEPVGAFVSSERNSVTNEWFTTAAGGVFRMYTSTPFAAKEKLTLETTKTGAAVTKRVLAGEARKWEVRL